MDKSASNRESTLGATGNFEERNKTFRARHFEEVIKTSKTNDTSRRELAPLSQMFLKGWVR